MTCTFTNVIFLHDTFTFTHSGFGEPFYNTGRNITWQKFLLWCYRDASTYQSHFPDVENMLFGTDSSKNHITTTFRFFFPGENEKHKLPYPLKSWLICENIYMIKKKRYSAHRSAACLVWNYQPTYSINRHLRKHTLLHWHCKCKSDLGSVQWGVINNTNKLFGTNI